MTKKSIPLLLTFACINTLVVGQTLSPAGQAEHPQHDAPITRPLNNEISEAGNNYGFDMAPETTPRVVAAVIKSIKHKGPKGPLKPTWASLKANYQVPEWFKVAKFGICMHWGLYSVPAFGNEWYEKHMYGDPKTMKWHAEHFGPQDQFGYKDFIPLFTAERFDPNALAELIKKSGARFFSPACQHHDGFALWDSKVAPFNSKLMGPHRDIIGELAKAVRERGLKFGITNHQIENFQFINPPAELAEKMRSESADLYDPKWANFYNYADRSGEACRKFLVNWYERNVELIDKYRPDILYFDNGVDQRYLDPLKLQVAAYYYNRAKEWGKQVTIDTKKAAYAPSGVNTGTIGSVVDFESNVPPGIRSGVWNADTPIGSTWGYTEGMHSADAASLVAKLIDIASKNGTMMLNISPKGDGSIPQQQVDALLGIGKWLDINGEAIYGTHNWIKFGEGDLKKGRKISFTVKGDVLYAIIQGPWNNGQLTVSALPESMGRISSVSLLGDSEKLTYNQDSNGLNVILPAKQPCDIAWSLKIKGLKMNPNTTTKDGNPIEYQNQ